MSTKQKTYTLRQARQLRGWTQEELAARLQIGQTTISKLELGTNRQPLYGVGLEIARVLGLDPYQLRFGEGEEA